MMRSLLVAALATVVVSGPALAPVAARGQPAAQAAGVTPAMQADYDAVLEFLIGSPMTPAERAESRRLAAQEYRADPAKFRRGQVEVRKLLARIRASNDPVRLAALRADLYAAVHFANDPESQAGLRLIARRNPIIVADPETKTVVTARALDAFVELLRTTASLSGETVPGGAPAIRANLLSQLRNDYRGLAPADRVGLAGSEVVLIRANQLLAAVPSERRRALAREAVQRNPNHLINASNALIAGLRGQRGGTTADWLRSRRAGSAAMTGMQLNHLNVLSIHKGF